ncbi:c-type cytochrome biogenesis protein CcmI [Oryzibacter oryziterrae]|uniref:c-type cytochrome biogenesis protein CcmI n=1 Tax=Oryzibacter oryziterrae TaxID=2766474 RepID=UPI001EFFB7EE|nr:c-type cytochrome biogenesis protein CcmI [Oryzibacter oryziterrae]
MLLWTIFALLTAAAALIILLPLMRSRASANMDRAQEVAIYKDQLQELDRDRSRGLIGETEAEAARTEIARRLLAAGTATDDTVPARRSLRLPAAVATVMLVPFAAIGLYLTFGSPDLPDLPLSARLQGQPTDTNVNDMVARVEKHLETNPDDAEGWKVLVPFYMRAGRFDDAASALSKIIALGKATDDDREAYGEALVANNDGIVTKDAQAVLEQVVKADPDRPKARYYYAEGLRQSGDNAGALAQFDELIKRSPADAPWLEVVRGKRKDVLAALKMPADTKEPDTLPPLDPPEATMAPDGKGPTAADMQAAAGMSAQDRGSMIAGMVQQLADRLAANPKDPDGWVKLMRSYMVLNRIDDAKAAYQKARDALKDDAATLQTLDAAAKELGVN